MRTMGHKLIFISIFLSSYVASIPRKNVTDGNMAQYLDQIKKGNIVRVDLYYESLCPDCRAQYPELFKLLKKLGKYVDLHTYPYGNAKTKDKNGTKSVDCQHGEDECYGNKLHACAIDILKDINVYIDYNVCLMAKKSNDTAADVCAESRHIDSGPIKECAKGQKGQALLIRYGEQSEPIRFKSVPHVLINGIIRTIDEPNLLIKRVCKVLSNPPEECVFKDDS